MLELDYSVCSTSIQQALVKHRRTIGAKTARYSNHQIRWGMHNVQAHFWAAVPTAGILHLVFKRISVPQAIAVDIHAEGGQIQLLNQSVPTLRTWADPDYEDQVSYSFTCNGYICVSAVSSILLGNGKRLIERGTGNSAFWVEEKMELEKMWTFHVSHALDKPPNFDSLEFSLEVV